MKKLSSFVLVPLLIAALTLLVIEGAYSVVRWKHAERSLTYGIATALRSNADSGQGLLSQSGLRLAGRGEIESLVPAMIESGVGMGNVPYKELMTDRAAINGIGPDGCRSPKPNIKKLTTYIRTMDYELLDPPSMFYDMQAKIGEPLQTFVDTFGVRTAKFTSNAEGERTTLPAVVSSKKILVAGDSVAVGSMIDDSETIASQLQRGNAGVQYINLGVNGASAADIVCRLKMAATHYKGELAGLIYVYAESDFDRDLPFGQPEQVISWLVGFARDENIPKVTIVFAPYIYNIIPHLTRFNGYRGADHGIFSEESARLKKVTLEVGFDYVSIADVALEEGRARGTDFAVFALYVDHAHLSNYGVSLVVKKLPRD